jgi:hypothetical protein
VRDLAIANTVRLQGFSVCALTGPFARLCPDRAQGWFVTQPQCPHCERSLSSAFRPEPRKCLPESTVIAGAKGISRQLYRCTRLVFATAVIRALSAKAAGRLRLRCLL